MKSTQLTTHTLALPLFVAAVISMAILLVGPQATYAYSYVGYSTIQYQSPTNYWHYNRYPYTNAQHPSCQYTAHHQYHQYQYQYTQPTCQHYGYGRYQYEQPTYYLYNSYYSQYQYDYSYYPQHTWYGQIGQMPQCWNYGYCNYTSGVYY